MTTKRDQAAGQHQSQLDTAVLRADMNKGGLSCELIWNDIPRARVRLDCDGDATEKRYLVASVAFAVTTYNRAMETLDAIRRSGSVAVHHQAVDELRAELVDAWARTLGGGR